MTSQNGFHIVRYMGNKIKLLNFITAEISKITNKGDLICDIMAGTSNVGYAIKNNHPVISNDIQYYSYVIAKFLMNNPVKFNLNKEICNLRKNYLFNKKNKKYAFFYKNYSNTYFSSNQCLDIDSIRYAISNSAKKLQPLFLCCLMNAMCKAQSTTGHFAQFLDKKCSRVAKLRLISIYEIFIKNIKEFKNIISSKYKNTQFNLDYNDLLKNKIIKKVKCFYLDPPYTSDQYSRFYHILETICLYDSPKLEHKALYRDKRQKSLFCYKKTALAEFEKIISFCKNNNSSLIISYCNRGVVPINDLLNLCKKYFMNVKIKYIDYLYSTQGKGNIKTKELLLIMR